MPLAGVTHDGPLHHRQARHAEEVLDHPDVRQLAACHVYQVRVQEELASLTVLDARLRTPDLRSTTRKWPNESGEPAPEPQQSPAAP